MHENTFRRFISRREKNLQECFHTALLQFCCLVSQEFLFPPKRKKSAAVTDFRESQSPKLTPISLVSLMIFAFGSMVLSLPATSFSGTLTISRFL